MKNRTFDMNSYLMQAEQIFNSCPLVEILGDLIKEMILILNPFILGSGAEKYNWPFVYQNRRSWCQIFKLTAGLRQTWTGRLMPTLLTCNKQLDVQLSLQLGDIIYFMNQNKLLEVRTSGRVEENNFFSVGVMKVALIRAGGRIYKHFIALPVCLNVRKHQLRTQEVQAYELNPIEIFDGLDMCDSESEDNTTYNVFDAYGTASITPEILSKSGGSNNSKSIMYHTEDAEGESNNPIIVRTLSDLNYILKFKLNRKIILIPHVKFKKITIVSKSGLHKIIVPHFTNLVFLCIKKVVQSLNVTPVNQSCLIMADLGQAYAMIGSMQLKIEPRNEPPRNMYLLEDQTKYVDDVCNHFATLYGQHFCMEKLEHLGELVRVTKLTKHSVQHAEAIVLVKLLNLVSENQLEQLIALWERIIIPKVYTKNAPRIAVQFLYMIQNNTVSKLVHEAEQTRAMMMHNSILKENLVETTKKDAEH